MRALLDTHALLWWLDDNARLGSSARTFIANDRNEVFISVVSFWEVALKTQIGKMAIKAEEIWFDALRNQLFILQIDVRHLSVLQSLPRHHKDPFDHVLMSQAIAEEMLFISADQHVSDYDVQVLPCSD